MPLDPHAKRLLGMLAVGGAPGSSVLTPVRMREAMGGLALAVDAKGVPGVESTDLELPGPGGPLAVRVYTPEAARGGESAGIVYFHGGAAVFCSIETHDGLCRSIANAAGCVVISVEYRLAPEHKFPAGSEDAYAATCWVACTATAMAAGAAGGLLTVG